jgi:alanyl-tRNA synthetase
MFTVAWGDAALAGGLMAGTIVREWAKEINGGGGGQAFYATAGGSNAAGMKSALEKARNF